MIARRVSEIGENRTRQTGDFGEKLTKQTTSTKDKNVTILMSRLLLKLLQNL